jgi:hypothetical protein
MAALRSQNLLLTPYSAVLLEELSISAGQEISRILWNPKAHYCVHKSPPLFTIQSHINPILALPNDLRSILIFFFHLRLSLSSVLVFSFHPQPSMHLSLIHATCLAHLIILYLITQVIFCGGAKHEDRR